MAASLYPDVAAATEQVPLRIVTTKPPTPKLRYSPYGDIAVTNNLAFTTTYRGQLIALDTSTGAIVWQKQMSAGSNASVAIEGNMLVTAAGLPLGKGQKPEIVAYELPT